MRTRTSASERFGHLAGWLVAALLYVGAAGAQEPARFELTPFAGFRIGGELDDESGDGEFELDEGNGYGLIFNFRAANPDTQWQVLYAHQATHLKTDGQFTSVPVLDLDVDYLHFGGTYMFGAADVRPFLALTAGLARFEPNDDLDAENYFSMALGGGVQLRATKRVGVRLEGRAFASLVDDDGEIFCRAGQGAVCAIRIDGTTLIQVEASAGFVVRF